MRAPRQSVGILLTWAAPMLTVARLAAATKARSDVSRDSFAGSVGESAGEDQGGTSARRDATCPRYLQSERVTAS